MIQYGLSKEHTLTYVGIPIMIGAIFHKYAISGLSGYLPEDGSLLASNDLWGRGRQQEWPQRCPLPLEDIPGACHPFPLILNTPNPLVEIFHILGTILIVRGLAVFNIRGKGVRSSVGARACLK